VDERSEDPLAALSTALESDPGTRGFAAFAESQRRAGRPAEAEAVARRGLEHKPESREGRLVLALALLDLGRELEARFELSRLAEEVLAAKGLGPLAAASDHLSDAEFDRAFDRAEADPDEIIDPNRVVEDTIERTDRGIDLVGHPLSEEIAAGATFATETMAGLLERQGDGRGAAGIRAALEAGGLPASGDAARKRAIAVLERWLCNIQQLSEERA
jgi:Flp pilus assembly protein TadD